MEKVEHIPCLYMPNEIAGNKVIIYFHGAGEDIGMSYDMLL